MIVTECIRSKASAQERSAKRVGAAIELLPPTEYPNLASLREGLVAEVAKGATAAPTPETAQYYAGRLIAMVGAPLADRSDAVHEARPNR